MSTVYMNILVTRTKHGTTCRLVEDHMDAVERARKFVGQHNPIDGCSRLPEETKRQTPRGPEFHVSRSTSFGLRSAYVKPIGRDFETSIG